MTNLVLLLQDAFRGKEDWALFAREALQFKAIPKGQSGWVEVSTGGYGTNNEVRVRPIGAVPGNMANPTPSGRLVIVEVDGTTFADFRERQIGQRLRKVLRAMSDPDVDPRLLGALHLAWLPIHEHGKLVAVEFATMRRAVSGKASEDILYRHRLEALDKTFSRTPMDRLSGFAQALLAHQDQRVYSAGSDLDPAFLELRKALSGRGANLTLGTPEFLRASLAALFDVQALNEGFFQELNRRFREDLLSPMLAQARTKKVPPVQARGYALELLMRLLFLRFLEAKGWILGDSHWLLRQDLKKVKDAYKEVLEPLFMALALPRGHRPKNLPDVPYLNGGLFDPDTLDIGGLTLDPAKLDTFRTFLYQHTFTLEESSPLDQRVAIDPEMLGRVFETLVLAMEEAEQSGTALEDALEKGVGKSRRKITGSYYTPRVIVQYLCRETLDAHLSQATGEPTQLWGELRQKAADPTFQMSERIPKARVRLIEDALSAVRTCDPAVGSGAFLIGMMQELLLLRAGLAEVEGVHVDQSGTRTAEWKRNIITRNLYGVDLNKEAVEICRLRLWLSLVIDAKDDEPLPSLDFRIMCGDSLVDRLGEETFPDSLGGELKQAWAARTANLELAHREAEITKKHKVAFAEEADPEVRRGLRKKIIHHSQLAHQAELDAVREDLASRQATLVGQLKWSTGREATKLKKALEQVKAEEKWIKDCLSQLEKDGYLKKPFLWKLAFPEVFEKGGFDIVVGNPPYVRQEHLDATDQNAFAYAFRSVYAGTADLYAFFFERAHQILKAGGNLGFITSNGFTKRDWGGNLSRFLATQFELRHAIDFGELKVFEATVEPYIIVGSKRAPAPGHNLAGHSVFCEVVNRIQSRKSKSGSLSEVRQILEEQMGDILTQESVLLPQTRLLSTGWRLEDGGVLDLYDKLLTLPGSQPLGTFVAGRMYYGIKTGLNEAFVIDEETKRELTRKDPKSKDLIKPWLRGRDVKRWSPASSGLHFLAVQNSGDGDCNHSWKGFDARQEKEAEAQFKKSYPAVWEHLKAHEAKLRPRADQGRFWWELRACAYYSEFSQPKVIWPEFARSFRLCYDDAGMLTNNKCYIACGVPKWFAGVMNSDVIEFVLCLMTNSIRGGFMQVYDHFARRLPIVTPPKAMQNQLETLIDTLRTTTTVDARVVLENDINDLVCKVYGLTKAERDTIKNWFDRRSLLGMDADEEDELLEEA